MEFLRTTTEDVELRRPVVIVDERISRTLWPSGALGKRMAIEVGGSRRVLEVIGVTNPVRVTRVRDEDMAHFFVPYHFYPIELSLVIKTRQSAALSSPQ